MTKKAVFQVVGGFILEEVTRIVEDGVALDWPRNAVSCRIDTYTKVAAMHGGFATNYKRGPTAWKGQRWDIQDAILHKGVDSILVDNMRTNGWDFVVKTRFETVYPLMPGDVVIDT